MISVFINGNFAESKRIRFPDGAVEYILAKAQEAGISKLQAEIEYIRYLMGVVPTGILSHVSDSFDFWTFVTEGLTELKSEIMARLGKLVIRPDSGDPVLVICGNGSPWRWIILLPVCDKRHPRKRC